MNVDSIVFISCFLPFSLAVYFVIPNLRVKNYILLALGLLFYSFGSLSGLVVLLAAATVNYLLGLWLRSDRFRRGALAVGVVINLLFLAFYKYLGFLLNEVLGFENADLGLAVPLGISFFTFKSISYLVDTYRAPESGTKNYFDLLLYISFFPQIVAGPIARFAEFGPQLSAREVSLENVAFGVRRFAVGLSKKIIIAGTLGNIVDTVFGYGGVLDIRLAWLGAVGYSLQIYFDFSGYSDMAIGLGRMFGFNTVENFNYPYVASSIGNFWRRWHISLSSWFKDYLYIPLGGNRKGKLMTALNKAVVFTLCGVWHGANWTFLVWGFWHGLLSAAESLQIVPAKKLGVSRGGRVIGRIYTLLAVCLGFVMFRAASVGQGFSVIGAMFTGFDFTDSSTVLLHSLLNGETAVILILAVIFSMPVKHLLEKCTKHKLVLEVLSFAAVLLLFVLCVARLASGGFAPFIYAQF